MHSLIAGIANSFTDNLIAFAAGAMMYGFVLMMVLDVVMG